MLFAQLEDAVDAPVTFPQQRGISEYASSPNPGLSLGET